MKINLSEKDEIVFRGVLESWLELEEDMAECDRLYGSEEDARWHDETASLLKRVLSSIE